MASHRKQKSWFRFGARRRILTVAITAVASLALCALYVLGDAADVVPGYITFAPVSHSSERITSPAVATPPASPVSDVDASKPIDQKSAQAKLDAFTTTDGVGSGVSAIVADGTGKEVVSTNPSTPREPASTLKTLTALAASEKLDMHSTLDTQVYEKSKNGSSATIVLRGNGDMMLGSGASDPAHINGHAGIQTLASETARSLKSKGVTSVNLAYDDSLLGTKRMPSAMRATMVGNGNFAPVSSMAIDEGRQWAANAKPQNPDTLLSWLPSRTDQPALQAAQAFSSALNNAGVKVTGKLSTDTLPAASLQNSSARLASVSSAQLWELLRFTLQQSDNTYAELFGRLVALKVGEENSPEGAVKAVMANLESNGVDTSGLHLSDCSGLSDNSQLTTKALIQVQEKYFTTANAAALEGMGVSGFSGTALERSFGDQNRGLIRLKTGSLEHTTSMTGSVVRQNGGVAFFAVIVNNPDNMYAARKAIDNFVGSLSSL